MIPDEAVGAAARSMFSGLTRTKWEDIGPLTKRAYHEMAREALEAAAPHMLAQAWDEGADAECYSATHEQLVNPYRATKESESE